MRKFKVGDIVTHKHIPDSLFKIEALGGFRDVYAIRTVAGVVRFSGYHPALENALALYKPYKSVLKDLL